MYWAGGRSDLAGCFWFLRFLWPGGADKGQQQPQIRCVQVPGFRGQCQTGAVAVPHR